jgi:hypothetical protein
MLSLPKIIAPAFFSLRITSASSAGMRSLNSSLAPVVRTPAVSMLSFMAMGIPCRGPRHLPRRASASISRAVTRADSRVTVMNAFTAGLDLSIRFRHASVSSTGEAPLLRRSSEAFFKVRLVRSCFRKGRLQSPDRSSHSSGQKTSARIRLVHVGSPQTTPGFRRPILVACSNA